MKGLLRYIAHWLMTPLRRRKQQKYADPEAEALLHREFPNDGYLPVISRYVAAGEKAVFSVKGYSMRPFLEHLRDKVELSPFEELHVGDAVLAEISPGHFVLHRILRRDGDQLTLKGDGNLRGVEHCTVADVRGLVTQYIRPGGHVLSTADPRLIRKIQRWVALPTFVRRVALFIYRQTI